MQAPHRHRHSGIAGGSRGPQRRNSGSRRCTECAEGRRQAQPHAAPHFADGGYAGPKLRDALKQIARWTVQIVKRSDIAEGFEVLPRRRVVERTLAWLGRCRRLSKDREKSIASAEAWVLIAHIRRVTRYLEKA